MASATYEAIVREVDTLTDQEKRELVAHLTSSTTAAPNALATLLLNLPPLDPHAIDEMERAINEECERIDPHVRHAAAAR